MVTTTKDAQPSGRKRSGTARVKRSSLRDTALRELTALIVRGELTPGNPIGEVELAERLGMSRTPIREALHALASENLVKIVPNVGAFVTHMSASSLRELFEVREAVEGMLCRLAVRRASDEAIQRIVDAFAQEQTAKDETDRIERMEHAGDVLHETIMEMAGNPRLNRIMESYHFQIQIEKQVAAHIRGRVFQSFNEHCAILDAMIVRDASKAEQAMQTHISSTLRSILDSYKS